MAPTVSLTKEGFTLIEVLVSLLILMVGLLGLLEIVNVSIAHNLNNQFRNEAIMLADRTMNNVKMAPFNNISVKTTYSNYSCRMNLGYKNYSVTKTTTNPTTNTKRVEIMIAWRYKAQRYIHSIVTLISNKQ